MNKIYFSYPDAVTFSGQTEASRLIINLLNEEEDFIFHINIFPAFGHKLKEDNIYKYFLRIIYFYVNNIKILFKKPDIIYLNLGQSYVKFLLHALPILLVQYLSKTKLIVSLHGNTFVNWSDKSTLINLFKFILKNADLVTYLGKNQKKRLNELNIKKIKQVNNCIDSSVISKDFLITKQSLIKNNILHLSLLIESKGFSIFLDSFNNESIKKHKKEINAVLCGPIHFTPSDERFKTALDKEKWINEKIKTLNESGIDIKWIKGARGELKNSILKDASIFVFPSTFAVEAQPLVLLEAAANGCAIITTQVGEIKNTFTENEVLFLKDATDSSVASAVNYLIQNPNIRKKFALNCYNKLLEKYSTTNYKNVWKNIFNNLK
jgi:glycosyltransferase involved in cell wall biosynthesis